MVVKQIWACPKCSFRYESPIRLYEANCPKHVKAMSMKLVSGEPEPIRKSKAVTIKSGEQLKKALGITLGETRE